MQDVAMHTVWVCGMITHVDGCQSWDLVGVFQDRQLALAACEDEDFFIFPVKVNDRAPRETVAPSGMEWPHARGDQPDEYEPPRRPR